MAAFLQQITLSGIVLLAATAWLGAGEGIDSIMLRDPDFPLPKVVKVFPENLPDVWLKYLARPESEYKIRAADTIAEAHRRGMKGLEKTIPNLIAELDRPDVPSSVRLAIVHALSDLDARQAADAMARAASSGDIDVRQIVDPCLTRWQYEPVRATWMERIQAKPSQRGTILAIRGLRAARDERAIPRLRELALDRDELAPVRLEAAAAVAELQPRGLEPQARELLRSVGRTGTVSRVVAATLLRHHDSDAAIELLQKCVRDPEPTVAARAMTRLLELEPKHTAPILDNALKNPDASVRSLAVEALGRVPSDETLTQLGDRLSDVHPSVRTQSRLSLLKLSAQERFRDIVIREGMRNLNGMFWGGNQQAALLLGEIGHQPAVERILVLMDHERLEVFVTAAWAFRKLNVAEKADPALKIFNRRLAMLSDPNSKISGNVAMAFDEQLSQIAQYLGQQRYAPASSTFRKLIPPTTGPSETRGAAVWALGKIHEGQKNLGFEKLMEARLNAIQPFDVEVPIVRQMCAVTLARVGAVGAVKSLRDHYGGQPTLDEVSNACGWAIEKLTGEKVPPPTVSLQPQINFFAVPNDWK